MKHAEIGDRVQDLTPCEHKQEGRLPPSPCWHDGATTTVVFQDGSVFAINRHGNGKRLTVYKREEPHA